MKDLIVQCQLDINLLPFLSARYCDDPLPPALNGGLRDWNETLLSTVTPYLTKVNYTCDTARKLQRFEEDPETFELVEILHDFQVTIVLIRGEEDNSVVCCHEDDFVFRCSTASGTSLGPHTKP